MQGNKLIFNPQTDKRESVLELDPAKTPKQIIVTPLDGPRKGKPLRDLYSLERDGSRCASTTTLMGRLDHPPDSQHILGTGYGFSC